MWVVPFISTSLTYDLLQVYIYIFFLKCDVYIYIYNIIFNSFSMNSSINMDTLCNLYMYYKCLSYIVPCKLNLFANAPIARHSAWRFDMLFFIVTMDARTVWSGGACSGLPFPPQPLVCWFAREFSWSHDSQFSAYLSHSQRSYGH